MPVSSVIEVERRLIITLGEGRITFAEITANQDRLLKDPEFDSSFDQVIDVTAAEVLDLTMGEAITVAERRILSAKSKRAVVATEPAVYGMFRLMEVYHERHAEVQVFYNLQSALDWLAVGRA